MVATMDKQAGSPLAAELGGGVDGVGLPRRGDAEAAAERATAAPGRRVSASLEDSLPLVVAPKSLVVLGAHRPRRGSSSPRTFGFNISVDG